MRFKLLALGFMLSIARDADACDLLAGPIRILPAIREGQPSGFKIYGIVPGSLYAIAGVENGDIILTINGMDVSLPDKALELYSRITGSAQIVVVLERNGQKLVLE